LLITATKHSVAQTKPNRGENAVITIDSTKRANGGIKPDTTVTIPIDTTKQEVKGGFLDDKVDYKAEDSTVADLMNKKAYLYNHAEVYYQDMILKAGYIEIDFGKKLVIAKGIADSSGKIVQRPVFEQGPEKFTAGQITYNFETKKGKIKDVITQQGDGFIHGNDIKKDTSNVYYVAEGKYTTCDLEEDPHYYFSAKKIKVIPNDKIVCGPAELFIADVPTPLVLPFGYFPNKKGRKSGIIIPGYGRSTRLGYFLSKGGFYFGGSDLFDALITGDVYSNGGYSLYETTNYSKRYKYSGNVMLTFSHLFLGSANPELANQPKQQDYHIQWDHRQDPKAHPSSTFTSHVDFATSSFGKNNGNVTTDYLKTEYNSRIGYNKLFTGTPFTLNITGSYNQNVLTRITNVVLPEVSMAMNRIYPFKNNSRIGKRWYDQIGLGANLRASNSLTTLDTLLFRTGSLDKMKNGATLSVPISTSFTVLKYIRVTPSINTNGYLYAKSYRKKLVLDSIYVDTLPETRFYADAFASTSISTMVYGDYFFKTKHLKQIHQTMTPAVSFTYKPDYSEPGYGSYGRYYIDSLKKEVTYPYFEGIYGGPTSGKSESVSFSLSSTLEGKIKNNSDSGEVFKKVKLLDNIGAALSYNGAAKSFKWSDLSLNARTRLFERVDVNVNALYSLYHYVNNKPVDFLQMQYGYFASLTSFNASVSTSLRSKEKKKAGNPSTPNPPALSSESSPSTDELQYLINHPNNYVDFDVPWNLSLSYNTYYLARSLEKKDRIVQTFSFFGDISLTKKWKINASSGFDFKTLKLTTTSISVYRDLHCWEMHFSWVPFGYRQTFLLTINVKSSMLKDLQLKKQSQDNQTLGYQ